MDNPAQAVWVTLLRREGWLLVDVDERKVGMIIAVTDAGKPFLKVAGFHLGETMLVGERQERLSIKVERIPEQLQNDMIPKIVDALPAELRGLPIGFL